MDFTKGRRRLYERMMKEKPGFAHSRPSGEEEQELRKQAREIESKHRKRDRQTSRED